MAIPVDPSASEQNTSQPSQQAQPQFAPQQSAPSAMPQQVAQQQPAAKPAYTFDSIEAATAFAEAQLAKKRKANAEAAQSNEAYNALKQQVDFLVAQQRLAQQQAIAANVQLAAKTAGFRDPDFIYSAIASRLQYDPATGQPTNVQAELDALKANKAYLLEQPAAPTDASQQPPAQPGQQPQGQPQLPSVPGPQVSQTILQQPRAGLMNAPQSATTLGNGLTWEVLNANIRNPAWVAANEAKIAEFMANPANHATRPRR